MSKNTENIEKNGNDAKGENMVDNNQNNINSKEDTNMSKEVENKEVVEANEEVKTTEVAIQENTAVTVANPIAELQEAFEEEMEGLSMSFDRIKIPSGGGLSFQVPGENPDDVDEVKELVGIIVDHHPTNAYWENDYDGSINSPDCSSMDGKVGIVTETGEVCDCKKCPYNQFGSGKDGQGKACKNMHRIYIKKDGEYFPQLLTLPATSIREFSNYMGKRVVMRGLRSYGVETKITLKQEKSGSGIKYSKAQFGMGKKLEQNEVAEMKEFSKNIKGLTRANKDLVQDVEATTNDDSLI